MINFNQENLVSFKDATKLVPHRPNGKRIHVSALYRWTQKGTRGVKLESIRIGGTTYTSVEALQRFADRLTANNGGQNQQESPLSSFTREAQVRKATDMVLRELGLCQSSTGRAEDTVASQGQEVSNCPAEGGD